MTIEVAGRPNEHVAETMSDRLALPIWTLIAPGFGLVAVPVGLAKMARWILRPR
jgi:Ca2+:H+ antiporter